MGMIIQNGIIFSDGGIGLKYVKEVLWENLDESDMTILSNGSTIDLSDNILDYDEVYFEGCFIESSNATGKKITHLSVTKVLKETIELAKSKYGTGQYEGMFDVAHNPIISGMNYNFVYCLKVPANNSLTVAFKYVGSWSASSCTLTRIIGIKYLRETENAYSTTEHIVGKWVDGSTIYEKSFAYDVGTSATCDIDISSCNVNVLVNYELSGAGNTYYFTNNDYIRAYLLDTNPVTTLRVVGGSTYPKSVGYVTIRYTKSSASNTRSFSKGGSEESVEEKNLEEPIEEKKLEESVDEKEA